VTSEKESGAAVGGEAVSEVSAEDLKAVVDGNNAFAIDLYKKLAEKGDGNIVISPYSVREALAMAYAGARGETAAEMAKALHFNIYQERLYPALYRSRRQITMANGSDVLDIANSIWIQKSLTLTQPFSNLAQTRFDGMVKEINFGESETARSHINGWVAKQTREKIPELIKPGSLAPQTQLVLANAIYLNCRWAVAFPIAQTHIREFEAAPGNTREVKMMRLTDATLRIASMPDFNMLELPYENKKLAMLLILPTRRGKLHEVEGKLNAPTLANAITTLCVGKAQEVILPRFSARRGFNLNEQLQALGMRLAFHPEADFSGMLTGGGISVSNVAHEAMIDVDEKGTIAAAATAVEMGIGLPHEFRFRCDEPFLYIVIERSSGLVLFLGRCIKPN